jgi:2-amino-4-hydroxy-6-hydroxymethyldihydropteridine diphosphokinase
MISPNSFFIATGSNLGDRLLNLATAKSLLRSKFTFIAESRIYQSLAVDYLDQPDFYNQVLEFQIPDLTPQTVMELLLKIELEMGRNRLVPKGPRLIDLDIVFWGDIKIEMPNLVIPHLKAFERSFVILPLAELPGFKMLEKKFNFVFHFDNSATPLS